MLVCLKKRIGTLWFNFGVKEKWNIIRCRGGVLHAAPAEVQLGACRKRTPDCDLLRRKKKKRRKRIQAKGVAAVPRRKAGEGDKKGGEKRCRLKEDALTASTSRLIHATTLQFPVSAAFSRTPLIYRSTSVSSEHHMVLLNSSRVNLKLPSSNSRNDDLVFTE